MRMLVTGGLGFLGSRLVRQLLGQADRAVAASKLNSVPAHATHVEVLDLTGAAVPRELHPYIRHRRLTVTRGSVRDRPLVEELVGHANEVYHLATHKTTRQAISAPREVIQTNLNGSISVIDAAANAGVPLLLVSSPQVVGKHRGIVLHETTDRLLGPTQHLRWCGSEALALAEQYALACHLQCGLRVVIVRPFNVVGVGQGKQDNSVISMLFRQAVRGEPLTVFGDGSQRLSFVHVDDVVSMFIRLLRLPAATGHVVNVGGTDFVALRDLAEQVRTLTGSRSDLQYVVFEDGPGLNPAGPQESGDTLHVPDLGKLKNLLGALPGTSVGDLLDLYWNELRAQRNG